MYVYILFGIPVAALFLCMIIIKITCGRTETYYKSDVSFSFVRQDFMCAHYVHNFARCVHIVHNSTCCVYVMCIILHVRTLYA
jgi:hypothetical protein